MSALLFSFELAAAHHDAFSVAAALPARSLREFRTQIDLLQGMGASFHVAETTLQPLLFDLKKNQGVLA